MQCGTDAIVRAFGLGLPAWPAQAQPLKAAKATGFTGSQNQSQMRRSQRGACVVWG